MPGIQVMLSVISSRDFNDLVIVLHINVTV